MTTESFPILSIIVLSPLVGAFLLLVQSETRVLRIRITTLLFSFISLLGSLYIYASYDQTAGGLQFVEQISIVPSLGVSYYLAADGISITLNSVFTQSRKITCVDSV